MISQNQNGLHLAASGDVLCGFWESVHEGGAGHRNIHLATSLESRVQMVEVPKFDNTMILMIFNLSIR